MDRGSWRFALYGATERDVTESLSMHIHEEEVRMHEEGVESC